MKVFVSHHSSDKSMLAEVKKRLKEHGIDFFLAHADIDETESNYIDKIKEEIESCHAFLLIANAKSEASPFCNQEIGYALSSLKHDHFLIATSKNNEESNNVLPWALIATRQIGIKYDGVENLTSKLLEYLLPLKEEVHIRIPADFSRSLSMLNLLGSFDESNDNDKNILAELTNKPFDEYIEEIRKLLHVSDTPVSFVNGVWRVKSRQLVWELLAAQIYDADIDRFKECAIKILSEPDPKFDLPIDARIMAAVYNKTPMYSSSLTKGCAQTLALIGNQSQFLESCTKSKLRRFSDIVSRDTLGDKSWKIWGSLDRVLPLLAEAAPDKFLSIVDETLQQDSSPFDDLFSQESGYASWGGGTYIAGLLFALESIAWKGEYLHRTICILGGLAARDPGGKWLNRPVNSIIRILLPWYPQTEASWLEQKSAIKGLWSDFPKVAWHVLIALLPDRLQHSMPSRKPWSYPVSERQVTQQEHAEQIAYYSELLSDIAINDENKLIDLIKVVTESPKSLSPIHLDRLISHIESNVKSTGNAVLLWNVLNDFMLGHKKRQISEDNLLRFKNLINALPINPRDYHARLFNYLVWGLQEWKSDNYDEADKKLDRDRKDAIGKIFQEGGMLSVFQFSQEVKYPYPVGYNLAFFVDSKEDVLTLKEYLGIDVENAQLFIKGFINGKHSMHDWEWVDSLDTSMLSEQQKNQFLQCLPFSSDVWVRIPKWLNDEVIYWKTINSNFYPVDNRKDCMFAVDKFLQWGRPIVAIMGLSFMIKKDYSVPNEQVIQALLAAAVNSNEEKAERHNIRESICEAIKYLQDNPNCKDDDIRKIEWIYLRILGSGLSGEFSPIMLHKALASSPEFFYQILSYFKSTDETEEQQAQKLNAWDLLECWKIIPGSNADGTFSENLFNQWIDKSFKLGRESESLELAQYKIGKILIRAPKDPSGLWIHESVAKVLDRGDAKAMRNSFYNGFINARGGYKVDPTGKPERDLAAKYQKMADEVKSINCMRLNDTLLDIAKYYETEAERHIEDAKAYDSDE